MKVLTTKDRDTIKIPIKTWAKKIEDGALEQAINLSNLPFAFSHIALMPDCHQGYGMPIGGVLATENVVIPNAVGVDIGCGMCAVKTDLKDIDKNTLQVIVNKIKETIPVGFKKHERIKHQLNILKSHDSMITYCLYENAKYSLGTLGGGNHFIEIQQDEKECIWIMIHSGSRNLGKQVADHHNKIAVQLNKRWFSSVNPKHDLAFLPVDSKEAQDYLTDMRFCVDFARANRHFMMQDTKKIFNEMYSVQFDESIDIAHNYVTLEHHFNKNVWIHRKGATSAKKDEIGIIPGSQGTSSYIVRGLGNKDSFMSCSHGAGRTMGRRQAQKELNLKAEINKLNDLGVLHSIKDIKDLDEAPGAYKDIEDVMNNQIDLVEIITKLKPIAVIKG